MIKPRQYDFNERLIWSAGFLNDGIAAILKERLPGCYDIEKATKNDDRNGTDYWAIRESLPPLSVDVKIRDIDWAEKGKDDLALETWSVVDIKPGWTRDATKRTDYILWFWQDTGRFFLCVFPPLCAVFCKRWREWADRFKTAVQDSGSWKSECVFVPRKIVVASLDGWRWGTRERLTP